MTNFEFYKHEIEEFLLEHGHTHFGIKDGKLIRCSVLNCENCEICGGGVLCRETRKEWLSQEHNPYTIPLDTPVDTKVLVSQNGIIWEKRYFSHFDKQDPLLRYVCFRDGATSWATKITVHWEYCKLWKEGDENDET